MKNYRYDCIAAHYSGIKEHPQIQMKNLGFKVIKSEPFPIGDCWWFRVANEIENVPNYLDLMKDSFRFSDELLEYKTGKWLLEMNYEMMSLVPMYSCSICGNSFSGYYPPDVCDHCGAKME